MSFSDVGMRKTINIPSRSVNQKAGLAIQLVVAAAGISALFFLLTSGIPLAQAGLIPEVTKKIALKTMRISLAVFSLLMAACRWRMSAQDFEKLWPVVLTMKILKVPLPALLLFFYLAYSFTLIIVNLTCDAALGTRAFDLGIFAQAIWNTLQGDFLYSSIKGGICLLGDHVSPLLALISPVYALWPDSRSLIVLQVLISAACIFFIGALAKEKLKDPFAVLVMVLVYCFYLSTRNALHEDFHPEVLAEPLMFAAFLFLEKRRFGLCSLCLILIAMAKENMLGVTFILGAYGLFFKKAGHWGGLVMGLSALVFWLDLHWVVPYFSRQRYFYGGFFSHLSSPAGMLGPFLNPDTYEYLFKIFGPFLFFPFFYFPTLFLTFPIFLQNVLSRSELTRSFGFHYTVGLTPFVFIAAIYGWTAAGRRFPWIQKHMKALACSILFISLTHSGPSEYYSFWQNYERLSDHRRMIRQKLAAIPPGYSVLTHNSFIPHLVNRRQVHMFAYPRTPAKLEQARDLDVDYVIFDEEFWEMPSWATPDQVAAGLLAAGFLKDYQQGTFYIFKRA